MFSVYLVVFFLAFYTGFRFAMTGEVDGEFYVEGIGIGQGASAGLSLALAIVVTFIIDGGSLFVSVN